MRGPWQVAAVLMVIVSMVALLLAWLSASRPFCDQPPPACARPSWGYLHLGIAIAGLALAVLCLLMTANRRWAIRTLVAWLATELALVVLAAATS